MDEIGRGERNARMRTLRVFGAVFLGLGLLLVLLVVAGTIWTILAYGHVSADRADLQWMLVPVGLLATGGAILALTFFGRGRSSNSKSGTTGG